MSHSTVFTLEKQPESWNFKFFLALKNRLVASFNEAHASASQKYVGGQGLPTLNWAKTFQTFW